jgi:hypothetical protein
MPYSYLNYSDDYILDEIPASPNVNKSGRKFYVADTKQINLVVPIAGRLVIGESYSFSASAQLMKPVENSITYSGINVLSLNGNVTGTMSNKIQSEHLVVGKNTIIVSEGVQVTGKKDYDTVIKKLEKLVDLIEPFGPYDDFQDCVNDQIGKGKSADAARRICGALQRDLEEDYDKFALKKADSVQLELQVKEELMKVMPPINNSYMKFGNRQTTFVLGILESVEKILSKSQTEDTVQKGVIFNLSKEIIQRCKDLAKDVIPPTDSNFLRPQFLEIHDLYSYLIQYCENRNIVQDPMSQSLDDLLTEDEALRLSQELEAIELPS